MSDLDQLKEIMKVTGTPTADFVLKLQSQDVRIHSHTHTNAYAHIRTSMHFLDTYTHTISLAMIHMLMCISTALFYRPKTTSEVYPKYKRKICTCFSPKQARKVITNTIKTRIHSIY